MHAGNRCWQILTSRPRETVNQHTKMFRRDVHGGSNARLPDWLQPFTVNLEDLETHVPAHSSERENSDSEGDASKVGTKMEAQYSHSLPQIPKEIYSTNRRVWWLDNSRAQKRISEQSPVRCRGTRPHHSVDTTRVKLKLHRRRRRIYESFQSRHRSQK